MARLPDWEPRLCALLDEVRDRPFAWATWDCAEFALAVVRALTGKDAGAAWAHRGRYSTALGAQRILARDGHADVTELFDRLIGPRVAPLRARRGDLVTNGESMGVMWSAGGPQPLFLGVPGTMIDDYESGLVSVPVTALTGGWRIG